MPRVIEDSFKEEKFLAYVKENLPEVYSTPLSETKVEEDGSFLNNELHVINYLKEDRLNLNFRQVYLKN